MNVTENGFEEINDKWDMIASNEPLSVQWKDKDVSLLSGKAIHQSAGFHAFLKNSRNVFDRACSSPDYYENTNKEFCLNNHKSIANYNHPVTGVPFKLCETIDCLYSIFRVRQHMHYGRDPFPGGYPPRK
jgi:hypothetical protein